MSLKKVFSTIAAAAIAVGGLAIGASAASAAEATFGSTITLTATDKAQLEGHTFSAIKLADYTSDENGYVSVTTVDSNKDVYNKIVAAAKASNSGDALPEGVDPIAYISGATSSFSAIRDDDQIGDNGETGTDNSTSTKPWTGQVRTFVNDLTNDDTLKNAAITRTLGEIAGFDENGYSAVLTMDEPGLYLIFDTTDPVTGQDVNAIPMLVGTAINNASNMFVDENGNETKRWPSTYMGTVAVKNQTTTVSKTVNGQEQISASIGDTVNYQFSSPLPTTTGFDSTNKYTFKLTDTPSAGQTIKMDSQVEDGTFAVYIDTNGDKTYDKDTDVRLSRVGTSDTSGTGYKLYDGNGTGLAGGENAVFTGNGTSVFVVDLTDYVSSSTYQESDYAGKNVVVQYEATITANAPTNGVTNTVEVNSQNAVAKDGTEITYGGFSFTKTDATSNDLTGAKFAIKNANDTYLKQENGLWKAVANATDSTRGGDVDKDGVETATFTYNGLADGTYTVEETQAPTGYLSSAKVIFTVTIKNGLAVHFDETDFINGGNDQGSAEGTEGVTGYKVKNYKSISQLPLTGGAGIALFTIVGLLLVGAGVTVSMRNRSGSHALLV